MCEVLTISTALIGSCTLVQRAINLTWLETSPDTSTSLQNSPQSNHITMSDTTEAATEKTYTMEEVQAHNSSDDLWIVYNGQVYDVGNYLDEHPGGEEVIVDCAGTDATEAFDDIGHSDDAHEILKGLLIGRLEGGVIKEALGVTTGSGSSLMGGLPFPVLAAAAFAVFAAAYFLMK